MVYSNNCFVILNEFLTNPEKDTFEMISWDPVYLWSTRYDLRNESGLQPLNIPLKGLQSNLNDLFKYEKKSSSFVKKIYIYDSWISSMQEIEVRDPRPWIYHN